MPRLVIAALCGALGLFTAACSHYSLGTGSKPTFRTLHIAPVANDTLLPQARAIVSTRLRETFARDARIQLADSPANADATLTVTLSGYHRDVAAVREGDTGLARKFNVTLEALCTLREQRTGRIIFDKRPIRAVREVFTDSGQLQAEYQVLPLLAEALAERATNATLDTW